MSRPITGTTRLAGVIGSPVRHSLSPALHNAAFEAAGLDWRFLAFEVARGAAKEAIAAMRALDIGGFAVTMPHKADAAAAVDEVDAAAGALRSVNTVVPRPDGSTLGVSTDGQGFVNSLVADGVVLAGRRVVVLGAGGAARSIVDALGRSGVADIAVVNRTEANAVTAAGLAASARVGNVDDIADADVLVNTTPVGMTPVGTTPVGTTSTGTGSDVLPVDARLLHDALTVADIVYHPRRTALLAAAEAVGAATVDGLGMLVHQAVLQQELWTGVRPDPAVMRRAAEVELASRA